MHLTSKYLFAVNYSLSPSRKTLHSFFFHFLLPIVDLFVSFTENFRKTKHQFFPDGVRREMGVFRIWGHKLLFCIHFCKALMPCKSVCDVKSRMDPCPVLLGHKTNSVFCTFLHLWKVSALRTSVKMHFTYFWFGPFLSNERKVFLKVLFARCQSLAGLVFIEVPFTSSVLHIQFGYDFISAYRFWNEFQGQTSVYPDTSASPGNHGIFPHAKDDTTPDGRRREKWVVAL